MAKNVNHVSHIKSKQIVDGKPKLPEASSLIEGEIAINFAEGVETLSIKNESGNVVTFSSDNYYTEQKLGSGFTGENSGNTVTKVIEDNEKVISSALNDLNSSITSHTSNYDIHTTAAEKEKLNGIESGAEVNVQSDWGETNTTSDAYIQNKPTLGTAAAKGVSNGITNSDNLIEARHIYSGVGVTIAYDSNTKYLQLKNTANSVISSFDASVFIKDGMVDNVVISGGSLVITFNTDSGKEAISIPLTDIFDPSNYYTKSETSGKTEIQDALDEKVNTADIVTAITPSNSGSTNPIATKVIAENEEVVSEALVDLNERKLDASAYTPTDLSNYYTKSETSGKTEIQSALDGKADTNSVYTKSETSGKTEIQNALDGKANTATTLGGYGITDAYTKSETSGKTELTTAFNAKVNTADVVTAITPSNSGSTNPIATSLVVENEEVVAEALIDLDERKLDASAYTPTDLSNYYTKSETSGKTEIQNALNSKADTSSVYTKSETSGKTEIQDALDGKVNTVDVVTAITPSNSGSTNPIATKVIAENEEVVSEALVDLNERKLDASAYTPTDLSNYYTKSETSGKTEIQDALGTKTDNDAFTAHTADTTAHITAAERTSWNNAISDLSGQSETIAAALVELNNRISQLEEQLENLSNN